MGITPASIILITLFSGTATSTATSIGPENQQKAEEHFQRAIELYDDSDYHRALFEFERAYQKAPHFQIKYNLALCHLSLKDYARSLTYLEAYLAEGKDEIGPKKRADVSKIIEELKGRVGLLSVKSNVDGARVQLDGRDLGLTPFNSPQYVNIGDHEMTTDKEGYLTDQRNVVVEARQHVQTTIELKLRPLPEVAYPNGLSLTEAVEPSPDRTAFWTTLGITGTLGAGALTTGLLAVSAKSDLDDALGTFPGDTKAIEDARSRADAFALATDVLLISTAVGAGLSIFFWFDAESDTPEAESPAEASVRLGVMPGRITASGRF
jgi:hypothetical protein